MKIVNKFLFANIITGIISVFSIGISIYFIVGDAILKSLTEELIFESAVFEETYINNSRNIEVYERFISNLNDNQKLRGVHTLFLPTNGEKTLFLVSSKPGFEKEIISFDINFFIYKPLNKIYEIEIDGQNYLAYNTVINSNFLNITERNELLVSLMSLEEVNIVKNNVYNFLFLAILLSILISANISFYLQSNINKPISNLLKATEEIGKKNFDIDININSKDEFQVLGESIMSMSKKLEEKDKEQKQFYETLSHELKTPVSVISSYVEGLQSGIIENANCTYSIIIAECERLKRQLENTIYLSKLDALKDFYKFEKTNINDTIISSLKIVESVIIINEIDVYFEPSQDIFVNIDKEKFERAITNILYNCIKYTKDAIHITVNNTGDFVKLEVSDNGEGFPKQLLNKPFDGNIIGDKGGTGVGLTIIKKIVDTHNGEVILKNRDGGGAVYNITLPKF